MLIRAEAGSGQLLRMREWCLRCCTSPQPSYNSRTVQKTAAWERLHHVPQSIAKLGSSCQP